MRNEDINRYMPLVVTEAERIRARLPYQIELDDLVGTGIFAVIDHLNSAEIQQGLDRNFIRIIRKAILADFRKMKKWTDIGKWYSLSRNEKLIFVLHKFENISFSDIAELLDISETQLEHTFISTTAFLNG